MMVQKKCFPHCSCTCAKISLDTGHRKCKMIDILHYFMVAPIAASPLDHLHTRHLMMATGTHHGVHTSGSADTWMSGAPMMASWGQ
jgi:hypothetical protein